MDCIFFGSFLMTVRNSLRSAMGAPALFRALLMRRMVFKNSRMLSFSPSLSCSNWASAAMTSAAALLSKRFLSFSHVDGRSTQSNVNSFYESESDIWSTRQARSCLRSHSVRSSVLQVTVFVSSSSVANLVYSASASSSAIFLALSSS